MIKTVAVTEQEVAAFAEAVRGVLARTWPDARAASAGGLGEVWAAAAPQGGFELGTQGARAPALPEIGRAHL
ncbi:hypothetical protein [Nonomuraea sp. NPDC049784]|uniref:hypothetical protein n=1 Tax=Nonomuraea sp. NPDC049784 TaxID=3154361 RepID=UPI0033EE5355